LEVWCGVPRPGNGSDQEETGNREDRIRPGRGRGRGRGRVGAAHAGRGVAVQLRRCPCPRPAPVLPFAALGAQKVTGRGS
jgi:hypothetical protein